MRAPIATFFLVLAGAALALSPAAETSDTFRLKDYGISVYETSELYPPSEIERAVEENKVQCTGAIDHAHRFGFALAETMAFGNIGGSATSKLIEKYIAAKFPSAGKILGRQIGLKPRDSTTYQMRDRMEKYMSAGLKKAPILQTAVYAFLYPRPCPGGMKLAAKQAITIAVADYNYAIGRNLSRSDKDLAAARSEIKQALELYEGYDGFIDAETTLFTDLAPGGFNKIVDSTTSAAGHIERAIKYGEKYQTGDYEIALH